MHILNVITLLLTGLMIGNELAVSAFANPAIWQLGDDPQAHALSLLARSLGRIMPYWYGLCLAFVALEAVLHRYAAAFPYLLLAALIWISVIVFTIRMLVPINERIAKLNVASEHFQWKQDHKRWDSLHRVRILLLIVAFLLTAHSLTE